MTRRRYQPPPPGAPDPFASVIAADAAHMADQLDGLMDAVKEYDQGSVKGILYQKPVGGQGPYKWIDDVYPPFDLPAVFTDLRDRYGGGDFELRVLAEGKIRKVVNIPIAKERERPGGQVPPAGGGTSELLALMMNQAAENRRADAAAAERQMSMFAKMQESQTNLLVAVLPALAGGGKGTSASETVALITALEGRREGGGGIKETLEAMAAFRTLLEPVGQAGGGEGETAFDPDDLIGSGARLIGPAIKAISELVDRARQNPAEPGGQVIAGQLPPPAAGGLQLAGAPAGDHQAGGLQLEAGPSRHRILNLVRPDVLYFYARGHDAETAAGLVWDVIEAHGVTDAEITDLATAFALSPTGLDDLAAEGIDLRERPQWAGQFFAALLAIHSGDADGFDGPEGGEADPRRNGAPGAPGPGRPADS